MYFIKKIIVDNDKYVSSEIVGHAKSISTALTLLEQNTIMFIKDQVGKQISDNAKIIDILNLEQISEPDIDTMLIYRVEQNPHRLYVYQRKTISVDVPNWTWGTSKKNVTDFKCVSYFELEEYAEIINFTNNSRIINFTNDSRVVSEFEMVTINIGKSKIKIPKQMTIAPMADVLVELKNSPKFKSRRIELEQEIVIRT
jgi:hypothetical protein